MSFFSEICRRNVIRVAVVYAASSWLVLQIVDLVIENSNAPEWVMPVFLNTILIGLPVALIASWLLELFRVCPVGASFLHQRSKALTKILSPLTQSK